MRNPQASMERLRVNSPTDIDSFSLAFSAKSWLVADGIIPETLAPPGVSELRNCIFPSQSMIRLVSSMIWKSSAIESVRMGILIVTLSTRSVADIWTVCVPGRRKSSPSGVKLVIVDGLALNNTFPRELFTYSFRFKPVRISSSRLRKTPGGRILRRLPRVIRVIRSGNRQG